MANNQYTVGGREASSIEGTPANRHSSGIRYNHDDEKKKYNAVTTTTNNNNVPASYTTKGHQICTSDYLKNIQYSNKSNIANNAGLQRDNNNKKRQSGGIRVSMITMEEAHPHRTGITGEAGEESHERRGNSTNNSRTGQCGCSQGGCGPLLANTLAYFGATAMFMFAVNVSFLPAAPFPVIGNALFQSMWLPNRDIAVIVPLILWCVHYLRRFTEVLFVHRYSRTMPYGESIGASVYYWGFGFWIGYSANVKLGYFSPTWSILIPGIILFVIGETGNCLAHILLAKLRGTACRICGTNEPIAVTPTRRVVPNSWMFRLVSCPNYTFEIITWIGYGLAVFTLPAAVFFLTSLLTLCIYGYKKHKAYKVYFDGSDDKPLYPKNRKVLIPFIF